MQCDLNMRAFPARQTNSVGGPEVHITAIHNLERPHGSKPFISSMDSKSMDSNVTLDQMRHPTKCGFHALGVQFDPGDGCDRLGGHSIPVMEPKDGSISHKNLAAIKLAYRVVNLPQSNPVFYRQAAPVAVRWTIRRSVLGDGFGVIGVAFLSAFGFEVIEPYAGRDHFEKSVDGFALPELELPQQAAVVGAQFQIGFLDEIVHQMLRGVRSVPTRGSPHYLGDERLKSANEFRPCGFVTGTDACFDQVFRREC